MSLASKIRRLMCRGKTSHRDTWRIKVPSVDEFRVRVARRMGDASPVVEDLESRPSSPTLVDGLCCFSTELTLNDGSLVKALQTAWWLLKQGGWFACSTTGPSHEVVAVATAMGWRLEDVFEPTGKRGEWVLVLKRGEEPNDLAVEMDWSQERKRWTACQGGVGHLAPTKPNRGRARQRRCHVFGISIAKSGSRSLAGLFSGFRTAHEFEAAKGIEWITNRRGSSSKGDVVAWLKGRDQRAGFLECDSSQLHHWYLKELMETFPEARFLMTVREPRAWVRSLINHRLARGLSPEWEPLELLRFGSSLVERDEEEQLLAAHGLPPLRRLFGFWASHHREAMQLVPSDRLMILRLGDLQNKHSEIADFAGLPPGQLRPSKARLNEGQADFHLLERMPDDYVRKIERQACDEVWNELLKRVL